MTHAAASAVAAAGTFSCLMIFDHLADHCCYDEEEHQSHNKSTHNQFSFLFIGRRMAPAFQWPLTIDY